MDSLIHSVLNSYLLDANHVPGTELGGWYTVLNKKDNHPRMLIAYCLLE